MNAARLVKLAWVGMGFLLLGFFAGAKGWANTLEAMKTEAIADGIGDDAWLERQEEPPGANRSPGLLPGEPRIVDARFETREEAAERIASPVMGAETLDPLPPEGAPDEI